MDMQALYQLVGTGRVFSATFIKRTDGSVRHMTCRTGVRKHLKGDGLLKFNPFEKQLLPVFDMQDKGYKFISADSLIELKVDGMTIKF